MKCYKSILLAISLLCLIGINTALHSNNQTATSPTELTLHWVKEIDYSLKESFLAQISELFGINVFIETGTYLGATTQVSIPFFNEIHSIELSKKLYLQAMDKFKEIENVNLYLGDSSNVFPKILPQIQGKALFWLDGHYSGGITAKGSCNTPILKELSQIENSQLIAPVILIDDIRCFGSLPYVPIHEGYPSVRELKEAILKINPDYEFKILGDIAIAYLAKENVTVSPVIDALTISRLFENDSTQLDKVLEAENIIAQSGEKEAVAIITLNDLLPNQHSQLWTGLISAYRNDHETAYKHFLKAIKLGFSHWRVYWYFAQSAYYSNKIREAKSALNRVIITEPNFAEAINFFEKIKTSRSSK